MRTNFPELGLIVITTGDKRQGWTTRVWMCDQFGRLWDAVHEQWVRGGKTAHSAVTKRVQAGELSRPSVAA